MKSNKKYFRKLVSAVILCSMVLTSMSSVFANDNIETTGLPAKSIATLVNGDGEEFEVEGNLVSIPTSRGNTFEAEYEYEIKLSDFTGKQSRAYTEIEDFDGSYSVKVILKNTYQKMDVNGLTYYKITNVSGNYSILDSQVSVTSKLVKYGQSGIALNTANLVKTETGSQNISGTSFNINTGFSQYIADNNFAAGGGSYVKLGLKRGTGTWTFEARNDLYQSFGF